MSKHYFTFNIYMDETADYVAWKIDLDELYKRRISEEFEGELYLYFDSDYLKNLLEQVWLCHYLTLNDGIITYCVEDASDRLDRYLDVYDE